MLKHILYSVFWNKCPACHQTDVFITRNPFDFKDFHRMHDVCECCGEKYLKEPGFFYGAMYVSYALMVGLFMVSFAVNEFFIHISRLHYIIGMSVFMLSFMTYTFRISRLFWLNFFIRFDPLKAIPKTK